MRILTVCSSTKVFGAEVMSLNLLRAFQECGYRQLAVTSTWTDGEFSRRLAVFGVPEVALPLGAFAKPLSPQALWWTTNALIHAPELWLGLHRTINAFQPDVLLLTSPKQGLWLYPWLDRQASFLIEHSMKATSGANRWMYAQLQRKLSGFIAVSRFMTGHLQDLGVDPDVVRVIYNCLPSGFGNGHQHDTRSSSPVRVGIAGQISPHKGHDALFEATKLLKKEHLRFEVMVFGSGEPEYIADLRQRIELAGLKEQWKWIGYTEDQAKMYRLMDICVVPSCFDEPFGMVALEASGYGVPVVAANRGGLPEIVVDKETGLLMDPQDPDDLAEKIAHLVKDRDRAYAMGQNGYRRVHRQFSPERMISDYEKLFSRFVAAR
jgi:glycosyltransferase involved in cell wall biosynthesis